MRLIKPIIAILLIAGTISAAQGFGLGLGNRFGKLGAMGKGGGSGPACNAAPDGSVDLSECSNSLYLALII